ncbi:MAG: HlyD family efflux transporter periplasmic adaptor subunit [Planctomycetes bacterium]|nr:HlyD family efflux transporter periplasmic adaptor subunit [Planctomycetota bacterium]
MSRQQIAIVGACLASCGLALFAENVLAQGAKPETKAGAKAGPPIAAEGDQVIVQYEALHVDPPHKYKVTLALEPIRSVVLTAPFDGIISKAEARPNTKVQAQAEVARLDNTTAQLKSQIADAALKIAAAEQKQAADKDELQKTIAQSRLELAKAESELAKYRLEQTIVRAPYAGEVQRVLVSEGQFVRAGDPLALVVDTSRVSVEVPLERAQAVQGKSLPLKVESSDVDGTIESVLPLGERFAALRDVFDSIASAIVVLDNSAGKFKAGQTVYVPLIPRQPVAEVPSSAIANVPDGNRKVQVIRHAVVRDVPIVVMGGVGINRLFVSGPFADGDEVIYESSHQLGDGFKLKSVAATAAASNTGTAPAGTGPTPPTTPTKAVGF